MTHLEMRKIVDQAYSNYQKSEFVVALLWKKADYSNEGDKEFDMACKVRDNMHRLWLDLLALDNKLLEKELFESED